MRLRAFILWVAVSISILGAPLSALPYQSELYTEHSYLSREGLALSSLRARAMTQVGENFHPYLQLGNELSTLQWRVSDLNWAASFAHVGPGLKWHLGGLSLYSEARWRQFYDSQSPLAQTQGNLDVRMMAVYGGFTQVPMGHSKRSWLGEVYSENIYTSADLSNLITSSFVRAGMRWELTERLPLDLYLEPFLAIDRVGHYYYNRFEVRPSLRLQFISSLGLSASLIASVLYNHYLPRATAEPNPYLNKHWGTRMLLVVGGTL